MLNLLLKSFELGVSGFGGLAILGYIKEEFVEKRKVLTEDEFFQGLSVAKFVPGSTAGNLLAYIGYKIGKGKLMVLMEFFFLLPAVVSMFLLTYLFTSFSENRFVAAGYEGLKLGVVVLFIITTEKIILPLAKSKINIFIMGAVFLLKYFFNVNLFVLVGLSSVACLFFSEVQEEEKEQKEVEIPNKKIFLPLIIIVIMIIIAGLINNLYTKTFFEFSKIGFLTFGGGVAATTLIYETFSEGLNWITRDEFLQGFTISQMTPGPILNISVYIGSKVAGISGGVIGAIGIFTPGVVLMYMFSKSSDFLLENKYVRKITTGILLGFNGIIINIIINLIKEEINSIKKVIFFIILFIIEIKFRIKPVILLIVTGLISAVLFLK